jgi:hypothetical protein
VLTANSGSAFLGERLSFHNEATTSAAAAAVHANTTHHHHSHHYSSTGTSNALLQTSSCSIIAADYALAVSTSPAAGGAAATDASPLTTTEDCSSTAEDESYALGYDCLSESDSPAEGLQKWVVASSWGRVAHSDVVLQPCPKASPVGSGAAAVHQHLQSPTSWVTPAIAGVLQLLNPPVTAVIGEGGLCAASYDPALSYRLERVHVAAQLCRGKGAHSSYGPDAFAPRTLVLAQNFLLEYNCSAPSGAAPLATVGCSSASATGTTGGAAAAAPIGFAALCDAGVSRWSPCVVRVDASTSSTYANSWSEKGDSPLVTFFVRAPSAAAADAWQALLSAAARLTLDSMFEANDRYSHEGAGRSSARSRGNGSTSSSSDCLSSLCESTAAANGRSTVDELDVGVARHTTVHTADPLFAKHFGNGSTTATAAAATAAAAAKPEKRLKQTLSQATLGHGRFACVREG